LKTTSRASATPKSATSKLPSLREYLLVAQDEPRVKVYRSTRDWDLEVFGPGETVCLDSIDGEIAVDAIYRAIVLTDDD